MTKPSARSVRTGSVVLLVLAFPVFGVTRLIDDRPMTVLGVIPIILAAVGAVGLHLSSRALYRGDR